MRLAGEATDESLRSHILTTLPPLGCLPSVACPHLTMPLRVYARLQTSRRIGIQFVHASLVGKPNVGGSLMLLCGLLLELVHNGGCSQPNMVHRPSEGLLVQTPNF